MARKKQDDFEGQLERLEKVVEQLEAEDLPLDKGVELYKEGLALVAACRERLTKARNEMQLAGGGALDLDGESEADLAEEDRDEEAS